VENLDCAEFKVKGVILMFDSSGMLLCIIVLVVTNVSEEGSASVVRVKQAMKNSHHPTNHSDRELM